MKIFDLNAEIVNWSSNSDWKSDRRKQRKVTSKKWQGSLITAYFQLREAASLLFLNHWVCGSAIKPVVVKWRRRRALFVLDSRLVAEYSPFGPYARGATCFFFLPARFNWKNCWPKFLRPTFFARQFLQSRQIVVSKSVMFGESTGFLYL